jgi:signal transduction histidine kinase
MTLTNIKILANEKSGETYHLMVHLSNISFIKKLERKEIQKTNDLISSLAHEYRTPLNTILPISEVLKNYITDPQGLLMLRIIEQAGQHLENVINQTIDVVKMQNDELEMNLT